MVQFSTLLLTLAVAGSALAAPSQFHTKRIAQTISNSTTKWQEACIGAGGGLICNPIAVNAFGTLLAAAGPCDQQDSADVMVDLAKLLNANADMIKFAQIFAQQPRNTPNSLSVPYCQSAPKNGELAGLFQCQFQGANPKQFVNATVGALGTMPLGMTSPLTPAGSCPAHPSGPIEDGTQLVDQVSDPGVGQPGAGSTSSASAATSTTSSAASAVPTSSSSETDSGGSSTTASAPTSSIATLTTIAISSTAITAAALSTAAVSVSPRAMFPPYDLFASPSAAA
ncbi:hypothetical protein FA95DRAFT_1495131 [Auriscalpium vulgare]|uniref:Uncharacterized protein n=1 Tax=Auriscalpium vulgare TaxID=40419 RepID=A0ACB8RNL2_9AGAM|nr:hypothetical protein FA95DRAFT_1495131 [Auriscalpium vulgare]